MSVLVTAPADPTARLLDILREAHPTWTIEVDLATRIFTAKRQFSGTYYFFELGRLSLKGKPVTYLCTLRGTYRKVDARIRAHEAMPNK